MPGSAGEIPLSVKAVSSRWLRAVKITMLLSLLFPTVIVFLICLSLIPFGLLLAGAYIGYCWWLLTNLHRKIGLVAAIGTGLVALFLTLLAIALVVSDPDNRLLLIFITLATFLYTALVATAIKTYYTMPREPGDVWMLMNGLALGMVYFFVVAIPLSVVLPGLLRSRLAANQAAAVGSVRSVNSCAASYQSRYSDRGFPPTLATMGPAGEKCIDERLAGGKRSGYSFTYTPAPPNAKGRIESYIVSARPTTYGTTGTVSYFSDSSPLIRMTDKDRPATARDSPVP